MLPPDWIGHRRGDGVRLGWAVSVGDGCHVVDLLGRRRTEQPVEWLEAEEAPEALGIGLLADRFDLRLPDGSVRRVRVGEVDTTRIVVVDDDLGAASVIGSKPFPAPDDL